MTQALLAVIFVVTTGSGIALWFMNGKLDTANEQISTLREQLGKESQSRAGFEATARTCSTATEKAEKEAKARKAAWDAERKKSEAAAKVMAGMVNELLSSARPEGMSECDAMKLELDQEIERRKPHAFDDRHPDA